MKSLVCGLVLITSAALSYALVFEPPFAVRFWSSSGVALGKVVAADNDTIDIEVSEWVRATDHLPSRLERVIRYKPATCDLLSKPEPVVVGSQYLFLLLRWENAGTDGHDAWGVAWQLEITTKSVCLVESGVAHSMAIFIGDANCANPVPFDAVLDALRTFESCFTVKNDLKRWLHPASAACGQKGLREWATRSDFHAALAREALRCIEQDQCWY